MQTAETATSLNRYEDSRSVLVIAYTFSKEMGDKFQRWVLGSGCEFGGKIRALHFNEQTRYLTIDLDDGQTIKKYNPETLIYKPYAESRVLYNQQEDI